MEKTFPSLGVTVDVPSGTDVCDDGPSGSIFGPNGIELALYADPPSIDADRRDVIEGRCPVKTWSAASKSDDGWTVLFETEDGELGFEIGRRRPDRTVIFWGDRMRDANAREEAIAIAKRAVLS